MINQDFEGIGRLESLGLYNNEKIVRFKEQFEFNMHEISNKIKSSLLVSLQIKRKYNFNCIFLQRIRKSQKSRVYNFYMDIIIYSF